jgi:hypothetical protein
LRKWQDARAAGVGSMGKDDDKTVSRDASAGDDEDCAHVGESPSLRMGDGRRDEGRGSES